MAVLKSCATVDVKTRFLTNIWGYSEIVMNAAGDVANGVIAPLHVKPWGADVGIGRRLFASKASPRPIKSIA